MKTEHGYGFWFIVYVADCIVLMTDDFQKAMDKFTNVKYHNTNKVKIVFEFAELICEYHPYIDQNKEK